jgi:hypothetical protein
MSCCRAMRCCHQSVCSSLTVRGEQSKPRFAGQGVTRKQGERIQDKAYIKEPFQPRPNKHWRYTTRTLSVVWRRWRQW